MNHDAAISQIVMLDAMAPPKNRAPAAPLKVVVEPVDDPIRTLKVVELVVPAAIL